MTGLRAYASVQMFPIIGMSDRRAGRNTISSDAGGFDGDASPRTGASGETDTVGEVIFV